MNTTRTIDHESRLAYRLRKLSKEQREQLMESMAMGKTAWYARLAKPASFTLEEASTITRYLEALDNEEYDIYEMLRPVEITAKATA